MFKVLDPSGEQIFGNTLRGFSSIAFRLLLVIAFLLAGVIFKRLALGRCHSAVIFLSFCVVWFSCPCHFSSFTVVVSRGAAP